MQLHQPTAPTMLTMIMCCMSPARMESLDSKMMLFIKERSQLS
jgi:hypothetical protein